MSYILDALKKSENERRAGVTPGLAPAASYVVLPSSRSHHRGAALLVAAGMLGTGLALGNWRPWQEDMAGVEAPLAAPVAASVPTPAPVASAVQSPPPAKPRLNVAAKTQPVQTTKTSTVVEKKRSVMSPQDRQGVATVAMPSQAVGSATAGGPKAPAAASPIAAARPTMTAPPAVAVPAAVRVAVAAPVAVAVPAPVAVAVPAAVAPPVAAAPVAPVPVATATALPAPRVVAYRELPAAVQGALPNIVFGGFAGGGEADGRIAFINNRLVREGEEVSPGLRLETVDQDGVVLGFQGHHFRTAR